MTMLEDFCNQMEDIHTLRLGQNQFEHTTWQQLSGENLHSATWLAEAEESIKRKQKNSTESSREGEVAHMQRHAYDEKDVKLMGVEEKLKPFPAHPLYWGQPHCNTC